VAIQRTEHPNYTREQVERLVLETLEVAAAAALTAEDRAVLLPAIMDKLASKQVVLEQIHGVPNMVVPKGLG
jgi:hypothetical protein